MIREKLCEAFKEMKINNGFSYSYIMDLTGLSKSQVYYILNENGDHVRVETIEEALYSCGTNLKLEVVQ